MSKVFVHDCPGCKTFPECPCGDDNCPPECTVRQLKELGSQIREVVEKFDGEEFSKRLYIECGIKTDSLELPGKPVREDGDE